MDLFSFLNEDPQEDSFDVDLDGEVQPQNIVQDSRKRRAGSESSTGVSERIVGHEPGPSIPKKPRTTSPQPMVVDEFETEAKREVEASAGLTGTVEAGSRLELRHQVRRRQSFPIKYQATLTRREGAPSSGCSTWIQLHSYFKTRSSSKTGARVQVYARPLPASLGACHSAK
jgi:hypothetical protein